MKIVFMGTPDYAKAALEALLSARYEVAAVVTQPDKAKGRSGRPQYSPVKECALMHRIPVFQPERIKSPEAVAELKKWDADIFIVAAFGQILSQEILDLPKLGCFNIHASLLPKYRGASPIQHVILEGEKKTGITIMRMDAGIDTGDILYQKEISLEGTETFEILHDRLMALGGEAITEALALLKEGALVPLPQDNAKSCYAPLITKEMGRIDFSKSAAAVDRQIRAMNPWPGAYTYYRGKRLKIWEGIPKAHESGYPGAGTGGNANGFRKEGAEAEERQIRPGTVLAVTKDVVEVACGEGSICIKSLQLEGKKRMSSRDFLLGMKLFAGECLGEENLDG